MTAGPSKRIWSNRLARNPDNRSASMRLPWLWPAFLPDGLSRRGDLRAAECQGPGLVACGMRSACSFLLQRMTYPLKKAQPALSSPYVAQSSHPARTVQTVDFTTDHDASDSTEERASTLACGKSRVSSRIHHATRKVGLVQIPLHGTVRVDIPVCFLLAVKQEDSGCCSDCREVAAAAEGFGFGAFG